MVKLMSQEDADRWAKEQYGPNGAAREVTGPTDGTICWIGFYDDENSRVFNTRGMGRTWDEVISKALPAKL